jgi:hypothetical protein
MGGQKSSHVDASLPVLTSVLDRFEGSLHEHSLGQIFAHRPSGSTGCHTYIQGVVCMMMAASANHQTSLQDERVHDEKVLFGLIAEELCMWSLLDLGESLFTIPTALVCYVAITGAFSQGQGMPLLSSFLSWNYTKRRPHLL